MKYKALFLDLDGTVVVSDPKAYPSERVLGAVKKASRIISVSIATGRSIYEAEYLINALHIVSPCILNHGAEIYDPVKKKPIWEVVLTWKQAQEISEIFRGNGLPVYLFNDPLHKEYHGEKVSEPIYGLWSRGVTLDEVNKLEKDFRALRYVAINKTPSWDKIGMSLEITRSDATKQHAVSELIKLLELASGQIIGVGDSYNDFPLLMACGLKIAMGNAVPELKAIADFIAPSVDDDGVATVIEKFILNT